MPSAVLDHMTGCGDADLYAVLGVSPRASPRQLHVAYRQLALSLHPDKRHHAAEQQQDGNGVSALSFHDLQHAYDTLSHAGTREQYDAGREGQLHCLQLRIRRGSVRCIRCVLTVGCCGCVAIALSVCCLQPPASALSAVSRARYGRTFTATSSSCTAARRHEWEQEGRSATGSWSATAAAQSTRRLAALCTSTPAVAVSGTKFLQQRWPG